MTTDGQGVWVIRDELAQRLGCGVLAAIVLPLWFLILGFAVESSLALAVSGLLLVVAVLVAAVALRRARRLPRVVRIDGDGRLSAEAKAGVVTRPLAELRRVDIGTSLGVWPVRLAFADGSTLRLPRELDDLDGFLDMVRRRCPHVVVADRNPVQPDQDGP